MNWMTMKMRLGMGLLLPLFMVTVGLGEEGVETWTPSQREAKRDLVIEGKIKHVRKGKQFKNTSGAETWGGAMEVIATIKGGYKKGDTFPFWFERGKPMGKGRATRTPPFPELKGGDTGTFYFTLMSPEDKARVMSPAALGDNVHLYLIETSYDFVPKGTGAP